MKIAVLGAGAMGALFGGYLSKKNDVCLIDVNSALIKKINNDGVCIREKNGSNAIYHPKAVTDSKDLGNVDLVITFVKSMFTLDALECNKAIIGSNTYLMTLQNGAGHENKLLQFTDSHHVIIGSTQHNSSVIELGYVNHGGSGLCSIGVLEGESSVLQPIADTFTACGLECMTSNNIQRQIWHKLFTNTAASSLTAIYQVPLGFIVDDKKANGQMRALAREAVAVANALGLDFDYDTVVTEIQAVCENARNGYTSIYADIRDGRKSEIDTISGSVVEVAKQLGIPVPSHEWVVDTVHGMERKTERKSGG